VLGEGELAELWSLVSWRREVPDPLVLLETAARRMVHPEVSVRPRRYAEAASRLNTLWAQPGSTAVLDGKALLQYPGVVVSVPLAEDADEAAVKAKAKLKLLMRLFLPVCLRVEVVWQEAVAHLGRASYLKHPFQTGARLADPWAALTADPEGEAPGPLTL
jgi:hypothetical protein